MISGNHSPVLYTHSYSFINYEFWLIIYALLSSADFFSKSQSEMSSECQPVWIQIKSMFCLVLSESKLFAKVINR